MKKIAPARDPAAIFVVANQYKFASDFLANGMKQGSSRDVRMPAVVCAAFALELFIKCLIAIEKRKEAKTHNLRELFAALSVTMQSKIRICFWLI